MRPRLPRLIVTALLPSLVFACETIEDPAAPTLDRADGGATATLPPSGGGPGSDPQCAVIPPEQSAPCTRRDQRCEWSDEILGITVAICDGQFWRVGERNRDCPAAPPSGRCGTFSGRCDYVGTGAYPKASAEGSDTCVSSCDCRDGLWECESSCKCPGKPTDDPTGALALYFKGACLHTNMRCEYSYRIGESTGLVGQPCRTNYTCSADGRWQAADTCSCPMFTASDRDWVTQCRSDGLQCQLPGADDTDPPRTCTCRADAWICPPPL